MQIQEIRQLFKQNSLHEATEDKNDLRIIQAGFELNYAMPNLKSTDEVTVIDWIDTWDKQIANGDPRPALKSLAKIFAAEGVAYELDLNNSNITDSAIYLPKKPAILMG